MVVDRRITGVPTEGLEVESVTVETPDLSIEGVEMTDDGGAIINPIEIAPENEFDSNLAELIDEEIWKKNNQVTYRPDKRMIYRSKKGTGLLTIKKLLK